MPELPFISTPLRSHLEVIERAREIGRVNGLAKVVVAAAEEPDVLAAMHACREEGITDAILVGYPDRVYDALDEAGVPRDRFEIIGATNEVAAAIRAAELAGEGKADIVMKGFIKSSTLLRTLLKSEYGLRDRELLSHNAVLFVPQYGKIINITDGGTLIAPTFEQKLTVLANGIQILRAIGIEKPKVAVLAPARKVRNDIPETLTAALLEEVVRLHWSAYIDIEGPVPFDMAVLEPMKHSSGRVSEVAGQADMILTHTIEEANIIVKTLIQFGGAVFMGLIGGAKVPISLVSRSDTMINKKASIALAVCTADYQRRGLPSLPPFMETSGKEVLDEY